MGFFDAIKSIGKIAAPIVGTALGGPLGGMIGGGVSKLLGQSAGTDPLSQLGNLPGQAVDALGGLRGLGGVAAGGMALKGANDARKDAQKFNQQRLDILRANLEKAEKDYDDRSDLREGGKKAMMASLEAGPGYFAQYMADRKSGKRKAGEFTA